MKGLVFLVWLVLGVPMLLALGVLQAVGAPPVANVRIIDERTPITICGDGQTGNPSKVLFEVPEDRRLEIEFASMRSVGSLADGAGVVIGIRTVVGGIQGDFFVGKIQGPPIFDFDARVMKVFADPGTAVTVQQGVFGPDSLAIGAHVCLSGRLSPLNP